MRRPKPKLEKAELPAGQTAARPKVKNLPARYQTGTNIEAFYTAQKEVAADSRGYAASRRKR